MAPVGYTTGALEQTEFSAFVDELRSRENCAIEFSALREHELTSMIAVLEDMCLDDFAHVSFHAPSKRESMSEQALVDALEAVAVRGIPIILHPDVIEDAALWQSFGKLLCIENMDQRKPAGRTTTEFDAIFRELPEASMCFDFAHIYQIDPTLCEAQKMLNRFREKIREIHLSSLNAECGHEALSYETLLAFESIASLIPSDVPVILEAPVPAALRIHEIESASAFLKETFEGVA